MALFQGNASKIAFTKVLFFPTSNAKVLHQILLAVKSYVTIRPDNTNIDIQNEIRSIQ